MRAPVDPERQDVPNHHLGSKGAGRDNEQDSTAPPAFSSHSAGIMEKEEGELIDFKTLHWL